MSLLKKNILLVLVNIGILAILVVCTEVILRIAGIPYSEEFIPSENALARFDQDLGWSYIPHLSTEVKIGSNTRMLHFDADGIRVPSDDYKLSATRPSVLFIGCSFTMGHGLSYEESFAGQFEKMTGNRFQAVNLGVQGYGTDQALLTLYKFAPRFNTKAVVYSFIEDHVYRNGNYDRRYLYPETKLLGTKPIFALGPDHKPHIAKKPLLYKDYRHSYLYDLLSMKLTKHPPYPEELTKALIRDMRDYCARHNIRFVMVNWRWSEKDYNKFAGDPFDIIDSLEMAPVGWDTMLIPDEDHPSAEANSHIARLLRRYFLKSIP